MIAAAAALVSTTAFAADLPSRKGPIYAPVAAPVFTWSGFYVGANVGYGFVRDDVVGVMHPGLLGSIGNARSNGVLGGLQAGYNIQSGSLVYGLEGDMQLSAQKKTVTNTLAGYTAQMKDPAFGTIRARLGYAMGNTLLYATGGVAFTNVKARLTDNILLLSDSSNEWRTGWTAGAGVEYAFTNNWSTKLEYLYVDTGKHWIGNVANAYGTRETQSFHVVRAGLNYKFGAPAPVVAKY